VFFVANRRVTSNRAETAQCLEIAFEFLKIAEQAGDPLALLSANRMLASTYNMMGRYRRARPHCERAMALDPELMLYDEPFAGLDPIALAVIGRLIRTLNDALGATSILVSHDVYECLQIVDYLYFVSEGRIVGEGTPDEVRASTDPFVRQFVHGETDGPVAFHYSARAYASDVGLAARAPHA